MTYTEWKEKFETTCERFLKSECTLTQQNVDDANTLDELEQNHPEHFRRYADAVKSIPRSAVQ